MWEIVWLLLENCRYTQFICCIVGMKLLNGITDILSTVCKVVGCYWVGYYRLLCQKPSPLGQPCPQNILISFVFGQRQSKTSVLCFPLCTLHAYSVASISTNETVVHFFTCVFYFFLINWAVSIFRSIISYFLRFHCAKIVSAVLKFSVCFFMWCPKMISFLIYLE